jgi:protein-disulfide isomerase
MDRLRMKSTFVLGMLALGLASAAAQGVPAAPQVQAPAKAAPVPAATGQAAPAAAPPLKLYSLNSETQADPFPPVNPKFFTADSPSVATVEGYLKTMLGFDANRIWRVEAIQKTASPGVSKVTVLISERGSTAKPQGAIFFVLPDGKHLLAGEAVTPFGAEPFAATRAVLQARADGPAHGAAAKDLLLVEFTDLQCPHCKEAQATMAKLEQDFPKARIVYQAYPLVDIHPYAYQAAAYGVCVAQKGAEAYFTYAQAVYNTQGALVPDSAEQTLKDAATKAGQDPAAIAACAAGDAAKAQVDKSIALANEVGVEQTPMLAVNGRLIAFTSIPYETVKSLIVYQATLDGAGAAAISPAGSGVDLKAH